MILFICGKLVVLLYGRVCIEKMVKNMDKVIVTGANGYLGSSLIRQLVKNGTEVYAVVNQNTDNLESIGSSLIHIAKSIDDECIKEQGKFAAVYHFAWSGNSGDKRGDISLQQSNINYACNILIKAAELGCSKFIFAGSIMEDEAISSLKRQDIKPGLGNIYSASKLTADIYLKTLAAYYKIPYICLLISNIYGPGEKNPRLINTTLKKFIRGEETAFSECTQSYDFIYIDDAVRKFIEVGEKAEEGTFYIGNPKQRALKDFICIIGSICGKDPDNIGIGRLGKTNQIIDYSDIDTSRIEREFGLENKISFEKGITLTKKFIEGELVNGEH